MDADGVERYRIEGYLPKHWFRARLEIGLGRVAFMHKKWADAEKAYSGIAENYANNMRLYEATGCGASAGAASAAGR